MGKQIVRIKRISWDVAFYADMMEGDGFIISEPAQVKIDKDKKKSLYGPQSPLYGTNYEDEHAFIERFRCECGKFKGRQWEGETCPFCNTVVESKGSNVKITGWICTGEDARFIVPYWYELLVKAIGKKIFPDIITCKQRVDTDGHRSRYEPEEGSEPLSPYSGLGIEEFMNQYDNILTYFQSVKKAKYDDLEFLKQNKSKVFACHIPIYSTFLRPQSVTSDTFYYNSIDKEINPLFNLSESIKECNPIEKPFILQRIQDRLNKMFDYNFELINGKDGFIRDKLLGGSLNYSSRNVIIPDPTLRDGEIDISYQTFRILFKYHIIYYLMTINDIQLSKSYDMWKRSYTFDNHVYEVMSYIVKKDKPRILINRNPTLNFYSILLMKIRSIKKDDMDFNLSVPLSILPGLNADFDGDILNMIAIINKEFIRMFRKFDPVKRMIISRDTGLLNEYFAIEKSQLIDLYHFATL